MNTRPVYYTIPLTAPDLHEARSNDLIALYPLPMNPLSGGLGYGPGITRTGNNRILTIVEDPPFDLYPRSRYIQARNVIDGNFQEVKGAYTENGYLAYPVFGDERR